MVLESSFPDAGHVPPPPSPHPMEMVDFRPQDLEKGVSMFNSCSFKNCRASPICRCYRRC